MADDPRARWQPSRRALLGGALAAAGHALVSSTPAQARSSSAPAPAPGSRAGAHPADSALLWVQTAYDLVLQENLSPPAASRVYACVAVAMHEAVVPGIPAGRSLAGQLTGLDRLPPARHQGVLDWPTALGAAVADVLREVLPFAGPGTREHLRRAEHEALASRQQAGVDERSLAASLEHGRTVAQHLVAWSRADGYAGTLGRPYTPPTGSPELWESTPPNYRPAIEPYWSEVRPLVLHAADEVEPAPPVPFSSERGSAFWLQAMAPYEQSSRNTPEQVRIARFWTDNPGSFTPPRGSPTGLPSGHWMLLATQGLALRDARLDVAVDTLALTGIALHEAFLNCWTWKYRFQLLRPVTYIHRYVDATWQTLVNTPQFPEHTSGHSVASPAAAAVLTRQLGTFSFTDHSHDVRGHLPRSFRSFSHAAEEAAASRLYGGIHYPHAIETGFEQGERIGALVLSRVRLRA